MGGGAPNDGNDVLSPSDFIKAPTVTPATKAMRSTLPCWLTWLCGCSLTPFVRITRTMEYTEDVRNIVHHAVLDQIRKPMHAQKANVVENNRLQDGILGNGIQAGVDNRAKSIG